VTRLKTIPKRSRRRILAMACVMAAVLGATVVYAKADFSVSPSPTSQTVAAGQAASYTVTVARTNGFSSTVAFSISGLPAGTTATFTPSSLDTTANSITLKLQTSTSTPAGTYTPTISATGANVTHTASITLVVRTAQSPDFTIAAAPAGQTVPLGADAQYAININRSGGFTGPVSFAVSGLPSKATASFGPLSPVAGSTTTLTVSTPSNGSTGVSTLSLVATASIGGSTVTRQGSVTLTTEKGTPIGISGAITKQLGPSVNVPIDVVLTNTNNFDVSVTNVAVAVEQATSKVGCKGLDNFAVAQLPVSRYPLTIPSKTTKKLSDLGIPSSDWPSVRMLNLPSNQDVCKGVTLTLDFSAVATK
jgi:hypothetical protein